MVVRLFYFVLFLSICSHAVADLKTDYYESAVNGSNTINFKSWKTTRDGKLILIREERDLVRNGTWAEVDQIVMMGDKKVIHFLSLKGHPSVIFYPDAQMQVTESDTDKDGIMDAITISDAKNQLVELMMILKDGKITPASDEELSKRLKLMNDMSNAMKNFK